MKPWRERIVEARGRGGFTAEDKADATGSWLTCAVGEQRALYGETVVLLDRQAQPRDLALQRLGGTDRDGFGAAVFRDDFDLAERRLDAIEDRTLTLKRTKARP